MTACTMIASCLLWVCGLVDWCTAIYYSQHCTPSGCMLYQLAKFRRQQRCSLGVFPSWYAVPIYHQYFVSAS